MALLRDGLPAAGMPAAANLTAGEATALVRYLRTLKPRKRPGRRADPGAARGRILGRGSGHEPRPVRPAAARRRSPAPPAAHARRSLPRRHLAVRLADLQRHDARLPAQPALADRHGQRRARGAEVDLQPAQRPAPAGHAGGGRRRDVRDERQRVLRARRGHRAADLAVPARAHARHDRQRRRRHQPRRGRGRRPGVHGHRSRASDRARSGDRRSGVGHRDGRLPAELRRHGRAAHGGQSGGVGRVGRRRGRARLHRRLRPGHRQGSLAVLDRAAPRRARLRHVEGRTRSITPAAPRG